MTSSIINLDAERSRAKELRDWASDISHHLYEYGYLAQAARALLHEYEHTEADQRLTGVSYLLSRLADDCERYSAEVSDKSDSIMGGDHG